MAASVPAKIDTPGSAMQIVSCVSSELQAAVKVGRRQKKRDANKKTTMCRLFKRGKCKHGDECNFKHVDECTPTPLGVPELSSAPESDTCSGSLTPPDDIISDVSGSSCRCRTPEMLEDLPTMREGSSVHGQNHSFAMRDLAEHPPDTFFKTQACPSPSLPNMNGYVPAEGTQWCPVWVPCVIFSQAVPSVVASVRHESSSQLLQLPQQPPKAATLVSTATASTPTQIQQL